jgi:HD-GYP domain-containing protein (c-di-GMP phosphodiesterase class II)
VTRTEVCSHLSSRPTSPRKRQGIAASRDAAGSARDQASSERLHLVERQLQLYAADVRIAYRSERQRAEQLAAALQELTSTYAATVKGFAAAVEAKDSYTAGHVVRVTKYGLRILELIDPDLVAYPKFEYGFLLHDIGKLAVPDAVLRKEGSLTDEEWVLMRRHSEAGRKILEGIPFLVGAQEIVYSHHERWDGDGYPRGLKAEEIPFGARVFPIADSFDAMTSDRPYRRAMPTSEALEEIRQGSGSQFWPVAVEAFLSIPISDLEAIRQIRSTRVVDG